MILHGHHHDPEQEFYRNLNKAVNRKLLEAIMPELFFQYNAQLEIQEVYWDQEEQRFKVSKEALERIRKWEA